MSYELPGTVVVLLSSRSPGSVGRELRLITVMLIIISDLLLVSLGVFRSELCF